jgi:L-ascorbate metabolism protein UlaG (beta-lactamase superfamily)
VKETVKDEASGRMVNRHRNTENLGYFVDAGGFTFFHNGDAALSEAEEYCQFDLPSAGIDVAFLGSVSWSGAEKTLDTIQRCLAPGYVVPMHLQPGERKTIGPRIEALTEPHSPFVIPGPPMTEVVLP